MYMRFIIEVEIAKEAMNREGKSIHDFDFNGVMDAIENVDKEHIKVTKIVPYFNN